MQLLAPRRLKEIKDIMNLVNFKLMDYPLPPDTQEVCRRHRGAYIVLSNSSLCGRSGGAPRGPGGGGGGGGGVGGVVGRAGGGTAGAGAPPHPQTPAPPPPPPPRGVQGIFFLKFGLLQGMVFEKSAVI